MRLIDADRLEEEIERKICGECEHHSDKRCSVYCAAYQLLHIFDVRRSFNPTDTEEEDKC